MRRRESVTLLGGAAAWPFALWRRRPKSQRLAIFPTKGRDRIRSVRTVLSEMHCAGLGMSNGKISSSSIGTRMVRLGNFQRLRPQKLDNFRMKSLRDNGNEFAALSLWSSSRWTYLSMSRRIVTQCRLWVISRHPRRKKSCPLYPRKQTYAVQLGISALSQKRTFAGHQYSSFVERFRQREFALTHWAR
jgi:hypothetical protein